MKKCNRLCYIIVCSLAVWLLIFLDCTFSWQNHHSISKLAAQLDIAVNFLILIPTFKIYRNAKIDTSVDIKVIRWLVATNIAFTLSDMAWYSIIYLHYTNLSNLSILSFFIDLIPFYMWVTFSVIFLFKIINEYVLPIKRQIKTLIAFAIINFITIVLFLMSIHYANEVFSLSVMLQISTFIAQIVVFDFAILCIIYAETTGIVLFLSGLIVMIAGDFFCVEATIAQTPILLSYGELLWLLGLLINGFGILSIAENNNYDIRTWVRSATTIRTKLAFWCFAIGVGSFLLFFVTAYMFSAISQTVFLGLPLFIMIYSVVVIILSLYMGKYFEMPFKQLAKNIGILMLDTGGNINNNFSIKEFIFLQQFILSAFKDRHEKEKLEKEKLELEHKNLQIEMERTQTQLALKDEQLKNQIHQATAQKHREIAEQLKQMAHDMASPIQSINTIIGHVSGSIPEKYRVTLRNASERISGIAQKLISKYSIDGTDNDEVLLVSLAVMQLINEKREEYINSNIELLTEIRSGANFACIQMNTNTFKRMLSNLINNAFDAVQADSRRASDGQVIVKLDAFSDKVVVFIDDNGLGMPEHIQEKFMAGIAVTEGKGEAGHGHGLTQAKEAIDKAGGELSILADSEFGTLIKIKFAAVEIPGWLATEIKLTCDDTVLILDDDDSIHGAWDSTFEPILAKVPSLKIEHFWQGQEVIDYIEQLSKDAKENTFLLIDYELIDQNVNGLDVVAQSGMTRAVLVTSYATSSKRQQEVVQLGIRMLPKELSAAVKISVDKKIAKGSRKVDMIWLEDKKEYLSETVANFYSHLTVAQYNDPLSLLEDIEQYPLNTRIILDTYYGHDYLDDGLSMASKLHNMGFTKLILYTGEEELEGAPDYLTVVSKVGHRHTGNQTLDKII